jgi:hypothetical protein
MIEIPISPNYRDSNDGYHGPCIVCGKPVNTKDPNVVYVHGGGIYAVTLAESEALDPLGNCGALPVGADCLRRYSELKPYAFKLSELGVGA